MNIAQRFAAVNSERSLKQDLLYISVVFVISILAIVLFRVVMPDRLVSEEFSDYVNFYEPVARNILDGKGYIHPSTGFDLRYGPGHPYLLAGIFGIAEALGVSEGFLLQIMIFVCSGLVSVFVFLLARNHYHPLLAVGAALVWITYPFALWFGQNPSSEHPFMVLVYGGLVLFWYTVRQQKSLVYFFVCGLLFGLAALIRPIGIGLGVVISILVLLFMSGERKCLSRISAIMAILVGFVVIISPWIMYVHSVTGKWVLISDSGFGSSVHGLTYAVAENQEFPAETVPDNILTFQREIKEQAPQSFGDVFGIFANKLGQDPLTVVHFLVLKALRSWYATFSGQNETLIALVQIPYVVLLLVSGVLACRKLGLLRQMFIGHWLVVLLFWLMSSIVVSNVRYIVPVMGLLFVFAPEILIWGKTRIPRFRPASSEA